jgi:hypothetical protein
MKAIFTFNFVFYFLLSSAQNFKKEIFLDINNYTINSETFLKKLKRTDIGYSVFESDSINTLKLVKSNKPLDFFEHYKVGKINLTKKDSIISELKNLSQREIDSTDIIVINFYIDEITVSQRPCIEFYLKDSNYKNFFKNTNNQDVKQFFITNETYYYNSNLTIRDKNKLIESLFFPNPLICGNYIIIFPNNNYILKFSEYRQDVILDFIKNYKDDNK